MNIADNPDRAHDRHEVNVLNSLDLSNSNEEAVGLGGRLNERKPNAEGGAGWLTFGGNFTTVFRNDIFGNRQSETSPMFFGAEKWLEKTGRMLWSDAETVIGNRYLEPAGPLLWQRVCRSFFMETSRLDFQAAAGAHCFYRVQKQVEKGLFELLFFTPQQVARGLK